MEGVCTQCQRVVKAEPAPAGMRTPEEDYFDFSDDDGIVLFVTVEHNFDDTNLRCEGSGQIVQALVAEQDA